MRPLKLATIVGNTVTIDGATALVIAAIIAAGPVVLNIGAELVKPFLPHSTYAIETAKLEHERRKTALTLYQSALTIRDPVQRKAVLSFLVDAGLLDNPHLIITGPSATIPYWPTASSTAP